MPPESAEVQGCGNTERPHYPRTGAGVRAYREQATMKRSTERTHPHGEPAAPPDLSATLEALDAGTPLSLPPSTPAYSVPSPR